MAQRRLCGNALVYARARVKTRTEGGSRLVQHCLQRVDVIDNDVPDAGCIGLCVLGCVYWYESIRS